MFVPYHHVLYITWGLFLILVAYLTYLQVLRVRHRRARQEATTKALTVISALENARPVDDILPEIAASASANREADQLSQAQQSWITFSWGLGALAIVCGLYLWSIWKKNE